MKRCWFHTSGHKFRKEFISFLSLTLGCLIMALGMNLFLIPNKIVAGGLSGIGTVLYHLFDLPVGMTVLAMNVPLFLASWKMLGSSFGIKTLIATVLLSLFIDGTTFLNVLTDDPAAGFHYGGRNDRARAGTHLS